MKAIEHILKEDHEKVKIDDMQFRFLSGEWNYLCCLYCLINAGETLE